VAILAVIAAGFLATVAARSDLDVNVLHDRNPLFVKLSDGGIRNGYTLKILNKARATRHFDLALERPAGASLQIVGLGEADFAAEGLEALPDSVATYQVYVRLPAEEGAAATQPLIFVLTDRESGAVVRSESIFRGPGT
jgi:polyferredoxin